MSTAPAQLRVDATGFAEYFAEGWRVGGPAERFVDHFAAVSTPDVLLVQPVVPPSRGIDGMREQFTTLFELLPELRADVRCWGPTPEGLLIQFSFKSARLEWEACDRIVLRDGLMAERHSYFDPTPLIETFRKEQT